MRTAVEDGSDLTRTKMLLFAFAAGAMIANIYYIQPLLPVIAAEFGQDPSRIGYLVTCTQLGYAFGVLLIVPLGDKVDPRRLLTGLLAFNAAASFLAALSQDFASFAAASMLIGLSSAATMVLVPYVASLAPADTRGEKVGQMMTGALLGILLAWTIAGLVAELAGWRVMYWMASAVGTLLLVAIRHAVSAGSTPSSAGRYRVLIASLLEIARRHEELRWRSFFSALGMASFSAMWTALPMLLSSSPYHMSSATIGFFGLTGTAGALASTWIGRLGDRGLAQRMTVVLSLVVFAAWLVAGREEHGLPAVILASVLLLSSRKYRRQMALRRMIEQAGDSSACCAVAGRCGFRVSRQLA
ncbi:hypothetical protein C7T35_39955, partial [Variovorax sp. WS11]